MSDQKLDLTNTFNTKTSEMKKEFYDECNKISEDLKAGIQKFGDRFTSFENQVIARLVAVETKTALFWKVVEDGVIDMIKQPIHFEKDGLLDRFKVNSKSLSGEELIKLKVILESEKKELLMVKDPKVMYYVIMLARIDQVLYDRECSCVDEKPTM